MIKQEAVRRLNYISDPIYILFLSCVKKYPKCVVLLKYCACLFVLVVQLTEALMISGSKEITDQLKVLKLYI